MEDAMAALCREAMATDLWAFEFDLSAAFIKIYLITFGS